MYGFFTKKMDYQEPGPSGVKKRKVINVKNPKSLTVEEMMEFLYNSDAESEQDDDSECE